MKFKPTIWALCMTVLLSVGLIQSGAHARCSPGSDYALNRSESVFAPHATDVDQAPNAVSVTFNVTNVLCYGKKTGSVTAVPSGGIAPYTYAWSNGKTTQTINNLAAGSYSVTVTGAQGSGTATGTAVVSQTAQIVAYVSCTKTCPNQCNGTASVIVLGGGTPPYTYQWSTTATTSAINNLCAGTYWVTITDANGCKKIVGAAVLTYPPVSLNGIATNVTCNASCTGTITQMVSGGGGAPFVYIWNDGATTKNRTGLCAGTYNVTVTSSKGCTATNSYTITQTTPPTVELTPTNPPCVGGDGSITSSVNGGTPPYTYLWSNGSTNANLIDVIPGSYTVTVTDANQCTATATESITPGNTQVIVTTQTTCSFPSPTACIGTASAIPGSGVWPYTYEWSTGSTDSVATGLCFGIVYTVTVTDANGCTGSTSTSVNLCNFPCEFEITITGNAACGATTATLGVSTPLGSNPVAYEWFAIALDSTVLGASSSQLVDVPGTYCVRVTFETQGQQCFATACTTIVAAEGPTVTITGVNPTCYGKNNGSATANVSGGVGPFTYIWSNGKTTQTINNLVAGSYSVTVTDANQCTASDSHILTQPPQIIAYVNCTKTCPGECTATINLTVMGGTSPYTYSWNNGATTEDLANVCAGIYWVTITDANGCKKVVGAMVMSYPAFNITSILTQPSCAGACNGAINISVNGGGGPGYTYVWSNSATTQDLTGLCAGAYTVTVTSIKGCTATATYNLENPQPNSCTVTNDTICAGGTGELCASTGASYLWSNGLTSQCISVSDAGAYVVTVTDANGCTSVCTGVLVVYQAPPCIITGDDFCYGDSTELCVATASSYLWSNGASTQCITVYTGGLYAVTVTYANGCTTTCEKYIQAFLPPVITTVPSDVTCASDCDGSITAFVTGDISSLTYVWSVATIANSATLFNLCPGVYCVTVTDVNGCTAAACDSISEPDSLGITALLSDVSCYGACDGIGTAGAYGGTEPYSVVWSNGDTNWVADSLCAGNYCFTVTDANGCTASGCLGIGEPDSLIAVASGDTVSCYGACDGTATVTATGGNINGPYTYAWSNGSEDATIDSLCAGQYCVTVTDILGCEATACVTIGTPSLLTASSTSTDVDCFNDATGSIEVTADGGTPDYSIIWDNGETTFTINDLVAGVYCYTVTDANGCMADGCDTINEPEQLLALIICPCPLNLCPGDCSFAADLEVYGGTPPYTYEWNNGATTQDVDSLCEGMYSVTVTDANGCTFDAQTAPFEWSDSITAIVETEDGGCNGVCNGSATVTPAGGFGDLTIEWSNGATTWSIDSLCVAEYCFTITDELGCTYSDCVTIEQPESPTVTVVATDVLCYGDSTGTFSATINGGTGDYAVMFSNGVNIFESTSGFPYEITGLAAGVYCVTIIDANGCTATGCDTVGQPDALSVDTNVTQPTVCIGDCDGLIEILVSGGTEPYSIAWNTGDTTSFILDNLCAGDYSVTVTDANGCSAPAAGTLIQLACPPCTLIADIESTPVNCYGACDGTATASYTGEFIIEPVSYAWSNGDNTSSIDSLCAGTYYVTVSDVNGCQDVDSVTITQPDLLTADATATPDSCSDGNTGTASVVANGGTEPYTYEWSNGATDASISGLAAGTYTVTVTDENGCTASATAVVIFIECPCEPLRTQTMGGWGQGANGNNVGAYRDANFDLCFSEITIGCIGGNTLTLTSAQAVEDFLPSTSTGGVLPGDLTDPGTGYNNVFAGQLMAAMLNVGFDYCDSNFAAGSNNLGEMIIQSGAFQGWTVNELLDTANAVIGGCATSNFTISQFTEALEGINENYTGGTIDNGFLDCDSVPVCDLEASGESTDANCFDVCDGTATVTITGGTAPYLVVWSNGISAGTLGGTSLSDLCAGAYGYTVTDENGCEVIGEVTVEEPTELVASAESTDITCYGLEDGTITVFVSGGTYPYTYAWANGDADSLGTGLGFGTYQITVTDANGCTAVAEATIEEPTELTVDTTVVQPTFCFENCDGSISITVNGGTEPYSIYWSTGDSNVTALDSLCPGTYSVTVVDANGCSAPAIGTIIELYCPPCELIADATSTNVTCFDACDGTASVTYSGNNIILPVAYAWSNGANTASIDSLCPGTYYVTVSDVNGCAGTDSVVITEPTLLTASSEATDVLCFNDATGSITVVADGGTPDYTIEWNSGETTFTISDLVAGVYCYTVTDANGCTVEGCDTVNEPDQLLALINCPCPLSLCAGDCSFAADLDVFGGTPPYSYEWSNGATTQDVDSLCEGLYSVTVTDANGCTFDVQTAPFEWADSIEVNEFTWDNVTCNGACDGALSVGAIGGFGELSIEWSNGATTWTIDSLCAGEYCYTITDELGCFVTGCATVEEPTELEASALSTDITCYGVEDGTISVIVTGGTYPYTFAWANGSTDSTGTGLGFGTYQITVTDANGCEAIAEATIEDATQIIASAVATDATVCINACDGSIDLTVSGGTGAYTFNWSTGADTEDVDSLCPGDYSVTVTDENGCTATTDGEIITLFCLPCDMTASAETTDETCPDACDGTATLTITGGIGGNNVIWSNGATGASVTDLCPGTYSYTITDGNICEVIDSVTINAADPIFVDLIIANAGICGDSCEGLLGVGILFGGVGPFTYEWNNGATDATITGLCAGDYSVTVTDALACELEVGPITISCEPPPCDTLRTQTIGGWGAEPSTNGYNPGNYLHDNFDGTFGADLVIGCDAGNTLTFTSAQAITNWLPSTTSPDALSGDMVDPVTYENVFAAQLLAATLNVGFDAADADFGQGDQSLGGMIIQTGLFAGWTVNQLLDTANAVIGGCETSAYTYSELSDALAAINENYVDGEVDFGYLGCDSIVPTFRLGGGDAAIVANNATVSAYPNPFSANANIEFTFANDDNVTLEVYNVTGQKVSELFNGAVNANQKYNVNFDGAQLADGVYIYRLVTSNETYTGQLTRVKP